MAEWIITAQVAGSDITWTYDHQKDAERAWKTILHTGRALDTNDVFTIATFSRPGRTTETVLT